MNTLAALIGGAVALCFCGSATTKLQAQDKPPAPVADRASRPLIRVPTVLTLEEARVIIEAAKAVVDNGRAAIAVVDFNGNLVSFDSMDGTPRTSARFALGKAVGAVSLQQTTEESADQLQTNPQRFHSALSILGGEVMLIPGGFPRSSTTSSSAPSAALATAATATCARSKPASPPGKSIGRPNASLGGDQTMEFNGDAKCVVGC
jgi:uncharacterized protein GlcG (DUF336 family)